jgi:quercetin dioxygenase-like cupin family protein
MNWSIRYAADNQKKRIMSQLKQKYPDVRVIDDAGSYFALLEEAKDHPEYDLAIQVVVAPTPAHKHKHTTHIYRAIDTPFNLFVDKKSIRINPGESYTVKPNTVHWLSNDPGIECWLEVMSSPGIPDKNPDVVNTRKRIASWSERYSSERYSSGIGQTINQLSQMIWPEGPKTMMSDVATITKMLTDPVKRQQALQNIRHPIQTMSLGAQMTIHNLKTKLMGPTEEKPVVNEGEKPVVNEGPDPNKINDNNYMRWYYDTLPKIAALDDSYVELFKKFAKSSAMRPPGDPRREAFKAYTSVPLKNGEKPEYSLWDNMDPIRSFGIKKNDQNLLDHEALIKVCNEWSQKLTQAAGKDERGGESYFRPVANNLAELKDWHQSQFQPQLGEGIFEPPTHREQITRIRRDK